MSIKLVSLIEIARDEADFLDAFAVQLGYKDKLAEALIKLQMKNLSAMDADPLYSAFSYTHPILPERLRAIGWQGSAKS
jgi:STE24 endopeptidase